MKLFINLIAKNSLRYLPQSLEAIFSQSVKNFEVVVIDNASTDGTADFVRKNYPEATVLRNFNDRGTAHAKNQAMNLIKNKVAAGGGNPAETHVLFLDPSVILPKDFIKCLVSALNTGDDGGSFAFKILRLGSNDVDEPIQKFHSTVVDSAGLSLGGSGRTVRIGQNENDAGQFDVVREIFAPDSILALFRFDALHDALLGEEYFDEDFFEGEEDLDLVWRLRLLGWKSYLLPLPHAYRFGGTPRGDRKIFDRIKNYHKKNRDFRVLRNHLWLLLKNQQFVNLLIFGPLIFLRELVKFFHSLILRQSNLRAYGSYFLGIPKMLRKRALIYKKNHLKAGEMRRAFKLK